MRRSPSAVAFAATAVALVAFAVPAGTVAAGSTGALSIHLVGLRNAQGQVGCLLFGSERGFPGESGKAQQRVWCPIAGSQATCAFDPIPAGTYAVSCFHDENGDGNMDRGLFGIPTEGWVVSNHARGFMGPPSFSAAKFSFSGEPTVMTLRMSY
jgi:uncharacterized protein (DUF2141 family)